VAITILALVSIPVLSMLLNGYSYTVMAGRQTVAANLCRDKIEELKSEGFSKYDLLIRDKPDGRYQIPSAEDPLPEGYELYRRETVIERRESIKGSSSSGLEADYLRVRVTVYWTERGGENSVEMETSWPGGETVRARDEDGFSLVELLMGLAILGMVTAAIYGCFFSGCRAGKKGSSGWITSKMAASP